MRPNYCLTMLHVSILAALLLTLEADSEDSKCDVGIRVRRNIVYKAFLGEDLRINCTVVFCNTSPPTVSWNKLEKTFVPVNVSSSSHIKTEWKTLDHLEGISYLIFQNILTSDSGAYHCYSGNSVGHSIKVSVHVVDDLTTVTWTTSEPNSSTTQDIPWLYVSRVVGIVMFLIIIITICVVSQIRRKGESRDVPDPSGQPSHDALMSTITYHVYENDQ